MAMQDPLIQRTIPDELLDEGRLVRSSCSTHSIALVSPSLSKALLTSFVSVGGSASDAVLLAMRAKVEALMGEFDPFEAYFAELVLLNPFVKPGCLIRQTFEAFPEMDARVVQAGMIAASFELEEAILAEVRPDQLQMVWLHRSFSVLSFDITLAGLNRHRSPTCAQLVKIWETASDSYFGMPEPSLITLPSKID